MTKIIFLVPGSATEGAKGVPRTRKGTKEGYQDDTTCQGSTMPPQQPSYRGQKKCRASLIKFELNDVNNVARQQRQFER